MATRYPVRITRDDNNTFLVTFPDVPGALTFGDTREEALERAQDALLTVFDACMKDRRDIPEPSTTRGAYVELPALETAKICLYREMKARNIGKAELAKRLDWHLPQVDRVIDVHHASRLDQMEEAFAAVGKRLELTITDIPHGRLARASEHARLVGRQRAHTMMPGAVVERARAGSRTTSLARKSAKKR
jgi:antitoxin HicB